MAAYPPDEPVSPQPSHADALYIPPDTVLKGPVRTGSAVWLGGTVRGGIRAEEEILILESGSVQGSLTGPSAQISGTVAGDITVTGQLVLAAPARVEGDIASSTLVVEEGAVFTGDCHMDEPPTPREIELSSGRSISANGEFVGG